MKLYKVIALSVNADRTNKVYESGDIVQENWFADGHAEKLVGTKHLEPYEVPAVGALMPPVADVELLSEGNQDTPPADETNLQGDGDQDTPPADNVNPLGEDSQDTPPADGPDRLPVDDEQPEATLPEGNKEKATTKRTVKK